MTDTSRIAIVGGGPAGLMAAETLCARGYGVDIYDAMPSLGRKFLMAGKSGLNITHAEGEDAFLARYHKPDVRLTAMVKAFGGAEVTAWMEGLGIAAQTGPTGRVFPHMMKASPLLRAWLARLSDAGAREFTRHRWTGFEGGRLQFETVDGVKTVTPAATVLAMGGGSWRRLGSDGAWTDILASAGIATLPFQPSNCGFLVDWTDHMKANFAGMPVKGASLSIGEHTTRGEFVITQRGIESGGVYALSAHIRDVLQVEGIATVSLDLMPDLDVAEVAFRLRGPRQKKTTLSNHIRKKLKLDKVKLALIYEVTSSEVRNDYFRLAMAIKSLPLHIIGAAPLDEAISTAGGLSWDAVDDAMMLRVRPGVFCAGEMLDWDAPTGGYLLTACFATGRAAGAGVADWLEDARLPPA